MKLIIALLPYTGFPDCSVDKQSACNAGVPSSIPGLGRSSGEGIGYPLQYSWASLVPQLVKNLPAVWETWVWSLSWENPLKKGMATHSSILVWRIPRKEEPDGLQSIWPQKVRHNWAHTQLYHLFKQFLSIFLHHWNVGIFAFQHTELLPRQ